MPTARANHQTSRPPVWSAFSSLALLAVASSNGCASYHLRGPSDDNDGIGYREVTLHGTWWQAPTVPDEGGKGSDDCADGINDLYVDDNIVLDLIGVLTLGIWKPMQVRYQCRAPVDIEEPAAPKQEYDPASQCAFLWGTWYDPQIIAANDAAIGFHDVRITDNFVYDLISVATLGLWKPMSLEYRVRRDAHARSGVPLERRARVQVDSE